VGERRIGVARGSSMARIAEPLETVAAEKAIESISALAQKHHSAGIVVGLPRSLDGAETAQTRKIRQWVAQAKTLIELPFYWQDEALTSKVAEEQIARNTGTDAVAASVILQDFLDTPEGQRVRC
jgi:putative holliday junction resolvase